MAQDVYLGVADVAKLIDRTPALVRYLERTGALPALRTVRGVRFFRRSDVERFKRERRRKGEKKPV